MPKFFGRRSKSGFVGPFGSFFGCFALMAAGAGAGFLLGAYDEMEKQITRARQSSRSNLSRRSFSRATLASSPRAKP